MSRPSKGNLSAWLRGGQTIGHTFDMIREVLARIVIVLILWGAVCVICVNLRASDDEQSYGTLALMANVLEWVGPPAPQLISVPTPGRGPRPYAVLFGAGTFLTTMLWFSDGGTWSARFGDGMGTAAMWLIAAVVMWLSKAIPFFHRHETVRWLVIGTPALIAAAVLLALSGGNTGQ